MLAKLTFYPKPIRLELFKFLKCHLGKLQEIEATKL